MEGRAATTHSEICHLEWLSGVLSIPRSTNGGIDLTDRTLGIEVKCRYDIWRPVFTIHAYQKRTFRQQNPGKKLFWAFLLYGLDRPLGKIKEQELEKHVTQREVWFLPWEWVQQFPTWYPKTGPYVYVHKRDFPSDQEYFKVEREKSSMHIPKGSILEERILVPF